MKTCERCGAEVSASERNCPKCGATIKIQEGRLLGRTLVEKYHIEEHLGSGGMCDVYRARHVAMGKEVAVKVLRPELAADPKIVERFETEANAASRIHHPHAINVTDYGVAEGNTPYIVMELVKGQSLGDRLRAGGAYDAARAGHILRQICGALEAAHSVGVVHRDIKPDNILIAQVDGSDWVEVADFGVAKIQEDVKRNARLTGANILVGTPRYMSPEQCDDRPVDARSDIYSLGVVLYEMLAGEAPFPGNSSTRLLMAHAAEPPPPLRSKRPDLSPELEAVVMSALEKDPDRRPQTASELARKYAEAAGLTYQAEGAQDRNGAFSRISVPLGADKHDPLATMVEDEATLVRPRRQAEVISETNTPYELANPAAGANYNTPVAGTTYVSSRDYDRRTSAGMWIGGALVLIALGVAAWIMFGDRLMGNSTGDAVIDAQQAITDSIARIEMLPNDHPLRTYLPQLIGWQGELRAYQNVQTRTPQMIQTAERYKREAENIANQALAAKSSLDKQNAGTDTTNSSTVPATTPAATPPAAAPPDPPIVEPVKPGQENENKEDDKEPEENRNQENRNSRKPSPPVPPPVEPVKPEPSPPRPANSNRPRNQSPPPPQVEKVTPQGVG